MRHDGGGTGHFLNPKTINKQTPIFFPMFFSNLEGSFEAGLLKSCECQIKTKGF